MIPVSKPYLTNDDIEAVKFCMQTGWISQGKRVRQFEEAWAAYIGVKHCVMTSSGTTALQLALSALGVVAGDEVLIPSLTFAAVANSILAVGATPVCVDVNSQTWNIDPAAVFKAATGRTKAIIAVHSYGNPCDIEQLKRVTQELHIPIIEDCAEAHGATMNGKKAGSFGTMSIFSFYANKIITTGEGGCVCTDNGELAERLRLLNNAGMSNKRYFHTVAGFNYCMTDIQAALGLSQLTRIRQTLDQRNALAALYRATLGEEFVTPIQKAGHGQAPWLYTALCPEPLDRDQLMEHLKKQGIESRPLFHPINSFPYIESLSCPNAEMLSRRGISLPTYVGLDPGNVSRICEAVKEFAYG